MTIAEDLAAKDADTDASLIIESLSDLASEANSQHLGSQGIRAKAIYSFFKTC